MGHFLSKKQNHTTVKTLPEIIPNHINELLKNSQPCCGKSDIHYNSNKHIINCVNCKNIIPIFQ